MLLDWHDPENFGPWGRGCWRCHVAPPVVRLHNVHGFLPGGPVAVVHRYALCFGCLCCWFPGWASDSVYDWLERQAEMAARVRICQREGMQLKFKSLLPDRRM